VRSWTHTTWTQPTCTLPYLTQFWWSKGMNLQYCHMRVMDHLPWRESHSPSQQQQNWSPQTESIIHVSLVRVG
jgi:hypothetical protein